MIAARHLLAFKQRLLRFLSCADVAGDLGGADDCSRMRPDRRHAERNIDPTAILVNAQRLMVIDLLAVFDFAQDVRTSSRKSTGTMMSILLPIASCAVNPNRRSAAWFQPVITPSRFLVTIASLEDFTAAMKSCSRSAYSRIVGLSLSRLGDVFERGDPAASSHRSIGHPKGSPV